MRAQGSLNASRLQGESEFRKVLTKLRPILLFYDFETMTTVNEKTKTREKSLKRPHREIANAPPGFIPPSPAVARSVITYLSGDVDIEDFDLYYSALTGLYNDATRNALLLQSDWCISRKERNRVMHSLNGNQAGAMGLSKRQAKGLGLALSAIQAKNYLSSTKGRKMTAAVAGATGLQYGQRKPKKKTNSNRKPQASRGPTATTQVRREFKDQRTTIARVVGNRNRTTRIVVSMQKMGDATVSGSEAEALTAFPTNPGLPIFKTAYDEARTKKYYRLVEGSFIFKTIEPDSSRGQLVMAGQTNLLTAPPLTIDDLIELPVSRVSQISNNVTLNIPVHLMHSQKKWLKVRQDYQHLVEDFDGFIFWGGTANHASTTPGYKVGTWYFNGVFEFKEDTTPGEAGTATPGDRTHLSMGTTNVLATVGEIEPITGWNVDYDEIAGVSTYANGFIVSFNAYVHITALVPLQVEYGGVGTGVAITPSVTLLIGGVTVQTSRTEVVFGVGKTPAWCSVPIDYYGEVAAGDAVYLKLQNYRASADCSVTSSAGSACIFQLELRGIIPGGNASILASTRKNLIEGAEEKAPAPAAGKKEEIKATKKPEEETGGTSTTRPPSTKSYKELVQEYNELQTQLDAIELVKVDKADSGSGVRAPGGVSLNC
jgi:hypothetical protein